MAALAGDDAVAVSFPDEAGDAQPGAGAEDDARRLGERVAGVQGDDVLGADQRQAVRGGGEIVGQRDARNGEAAAEFAGVEASGR